MGRGALALAILALTAGPAIAQSSTATTSPTSTPRPAPPPGTTPEATSGAIPLPTTTPVPTASPNGTSSTSTPSSTSTTQPGTASAGGAPVSAFSPATLSTNIMMLATPPSLDLSSLLSSTTTPKGSLGASGMHPPASVVLCPPDEAAAEQTLFVGTDVSCAP